MKYLKSPYFILACILLVLVVWFLSGGSKHKVVEIAPNVVQTSLQVSVISSKAVLHPIYYSFNGKTEAARTVTLKSRINSVVTNLIAKEGSSIQEGQVILKLATDDRIQQLTKAKAFVDQRELEHGAAVKLAAKKYLSPNALADKKTQFEQAKLELHNKTLELSHTNIRSPFKGVLNHYIVHEGDTVDAGDDLATLVELDPLYVKIYINENYYPHVQLNQSGEIRIQGMDPMEGKVVYIASVADDQTHTFECHIQIDNPEYAVPSGMSATIKIMGSNSQSMHKIPPVALSMDHEGCVGVKTVENSKVVFYPIQIQESNATEVWALGLPEDASIIITGQDFVKPGEVVTSIEQPSGV